MKSVSLIICLFATFSLGQTLKCYTCGLGPDNKCLEDPGNIPNGNPTTECVEGEDFCCTIVRQEYIDQPGVIVSFARNCVPNCKKSDFIKTPDSSYIFYQTYCKTPLCNIGPGNKELTGGGDSGGDNIHGVGGEGSGANVGPPAIMMAVALLTLYVIINSH